MSLRLICLLGALALAAADTPKTLKWPDLKVVKGQWKISFALTSGPNKAEFVPHNCSSQAVTAPCHQPPMTRDDNNRIQVTYQVKNATAPFRTFQNGTPEKVRVVMCYAPLSFKDRPWRKLKPLIFKDKNCPIVLGKRPFPTDLTTPLIATFSFNTTVNMATASWYVKVVTMCKDGSAAGSVCQFDETNATSMFFATRKVDPRSSAMVAAAVVCSVLGPALFIVYFVIDSRRRKMK